MLGPAYYAGPWAQVGTPYVMSGYGRLPDGSYVPKNLFLKALDCAPDFTLVNKRDYIDRAPIGGVRHFTISDAPPSGFYWFILALSALDTDPNAQGLSFYLLDPSGFPVKTDTLPINGNPDPLPGAIRIGSGHAGSGGAADLVTLTSSVQGGGGGFGECSPIMSRKIIVPERWRIGVFEDNTPFSGIAHQLALKIYFLELPKTVAPPRF